MKKMNKIIPLLLTLNISLFIVSFSVAFAIIFKPFYYWHIPQIEKETGYTYQGKKKAYDDVIDYNLLNKPFKVGNLKYSKEGKEHFKDCKRIFNINFIILIISTFIMIITKKKNYKIIKYDVYFWSGILTIISIISISLKAQIIGFDKTFTIFHNIMFPGKNNWLLNPNTDEIINILPERYFMNCGILIITVSCIISVIFIIKNIYKERRNKK